MNTFNFNETYLSESFFDDIEDDIFTDNVDNTLNLINKDSVIYELKNFIIKLNLIPTYSRKSLNCIIENNNIFINNSLFYKIYNENTLLNFNYLISLLKEFDNVYIEEFDIYNELDEYVIIDFNNINFNIKELNICSITPKNLHITVDKFICEYINFNYSNTLSFIINKLLNINTCDNITNYSFIKECKSDSTISLLNNKHKNNFIGLPKSEYELSIFYDDIENIPDMFTFEGIPDIIKKLNCTIAIRLNNIYNIINNNFSLKGLTTKLISKIDDIRLSSFEYNPDNPYILLVGPYKMIMKDWAYYFTKKILTYVAKSGDYYIECYLKNEGPLNEYNSDNAINQKVVKSALHSLLKELLKKDNEHQYLNELIETAKKYLKVNSKFNIGKAYMYVKNIDENDISLEFYKGGYNGWSYYKTYKWKQFFKWLEKHPYKFYDTDIELRTVIIDPVVKKYEVIKQGIEYIPESLPDIPDNSDTNRYNVEIIELPDGTLGLFGDIYPIKDKIKSLGGRFSKELEYSDTIKKSGWWIDADMRNDIENLIKFG